MRNTRLRKYRKKYKKLFLAIQFFFLWYCTILTLSYLTTSTGAYFNDVKIIENTIHAYWEDVPESNPDPVSWDKSSLEFTSSAGFQCNSGFYSFIKNSGSKDMQGTSTYVLYHQVNGSPKPNNPGKEIGRGEISSIKSGKSLKISFLPVVVPEEGTYKFMAYQRAGHPGVGQLWGSEIKITKHNIHSCHQWKIEPNSEVIDKQDLTRARQVEVNENMEESEIESKQSELSNETVESKPEEDLGNEELTNLGSLIED